MKVISKIIEVSKDEYYFKHLSILNTLLPVSLTVKEMQVLATFMAEDYELIKDDMFNSFVRSRVMQTLKISHGSLSNYLRSMIIKGFLNKHSVTNKITVQEFLIPENIQQGYRIKLKINEIKKR